jgi:hypothetical protein
VKEGEIYDKTVLNYYREPMKRGLKWLDEAYAYVGGLPEGSSDLVAKTSRNYRNEILEFMRVWKIKSLSDNSRDGITE